MIARAYCNWGRWVADCPRPFCSYAFQLERGQAEFRCVTKQGEGCHVVAPVEWPADVEQIDGVLRRRPVESTRNWFPRDHEVAVRAGVEHGQSVADLLAENDVYEVR